ncbi:UNVERIFIED_CONTAM: AraC family transcriptional regulator ligand-binding domain-containing protein, partial [Bacteroidetes bacterium 56_B9]
MSAWVRNGVLMGVDELAAELGGDLAALRRDVGLDGAPAHDPDFPIPASAVVEFLERAAAACACEAFGLLLSQKQDFS